MVAESVIRSFYAYYRKVMEVLSGERRTRNTNDRAFHRNGSCVMSVYAPRHMRRLVSAVRLLGWKEEALEVRANYVALETLQDELTRVFNAGQYRGQRVVHEGRLKFKQELCIFGSMLVPNSLIFPL